MESRYSKKILEEYQRLFNMPMGYGSNYVNNNIMPFVVSLVQESSKNEGLLEKLEFGEFQASAESIFATTSTNKDLFYFKVNNVGMTSDYAGFGQGVYYDGKSKVKKDIRLAQIMESAFHEVRHAKQFDLVYGNSITDISSLSIIYAKEFLVADTDYSWYSQKHESFYIEKEAELEGYRKTAEFVGKAITDSEFSQRCERQYVAAQKHFQPIFDRYFVDRNSIPMAHQIDAKLSQLSPERITAAMQKYPVLRLIYNENGTKKTLEELREMRDSWKERCKNHTTDSIIIDGRQTTIASQIDSIFKTIIKADPQLSSQFRKEVSDEMQQ